MMWWNNMIVGGVIRGGIGAKYIQQIGITPSRLVCFFGPLRYRDSHYLHRPLKSNASGRAQEITAANNLPFSALTRGTRPRGKCMLNRARRPVKVVHSGHCSHTCSQQPTKGHQWEGAPRSWCRIFWWSTSWGERPSTSTGWVGQVGSCQAIMDKKSLVRMQMVRDKRKRHWDGERGKFLK